ncbi:MAG: oligosaccharide flippase family protein [Chthonomonadales bacterium]|nr:oligosaccharide flippase family protein [Chthonomonadales bacterium]
MRKTIERMRRRPLLAGVVLLAGGAAGGQAATLLAQPALTRLYSQADYGVLAVYMAILSLATVACGRYEMAVPLPEEDEVAANLLAVSLIVLVGFALGSGLVLLAVGPWLARRLNVPALAPLLWMVPVGLLAAGIYKAISTWAVRRRQYTLIARTKLSQGIGQAVAQVALGLVGLRPAGLLFGDIVGRSAGSGTLASLAWRRDLAVFRRVTLSGMRAAAYRYRDFPRVSSLSALLNTAGVQAAPVLLALFYQAEVVGTFALSQRVVIAPIVLVGQAVSQVYFGEMARSLARNPAGAERMLRSTVRRLAVLALAPTALLGAFGPALLATLFGAKWREAGIYAQMMAPLAAVQFVVWPLSQTLYVLEEQRLQLCWDIGRLTAVAAGIALVGATRGSAREAVAAYAATMTAAYGVFLWLAWRGVRRAARRAPAGPEGEGATAAEALEAAGPVEAPGG